MLLTNTLTKKQLENIVQETFNNFGGVATSQLLDSLKAFGFFYAAFSGLSISLEDLKSPKKREFFLENSSNYIANINKNWSIGLISSTERFNHILDYWTGITESITKEIVKYYQNFDPANSLHIMSFSGARGNIAQVRQIVGLRGLMTDQSGNVISLPIQSNFREGLTSIDYLISAYGARKGVVDTALKTAAAGYLTRRLVYLAQQVVIRTISCESNKNLLISLEKNTTTKNLVGRYSKGLIQVSENSFKSLTKFRNLFLNKKDCEILEALNKEKKLFIKIQSALTCSFDNILCQKCYGWDLSKNNSVALGTCVGVIAAQSIGEPGTQLTMRTFHTGGIFLGQTSNSFLEAPHSGKIISIGNLEGLKKRTVFGEYTIRLAKHLKINIFHWKKGFTSFSIPSNLEFYFQKGFFYKKGQKIAEINSSEVLKSYEVEKIVPIYSDFTGTILNQNLHFSLNKFCGALKLSRNNNRISIASEKNISLHIKTKIRGLHKFLESKSIGCLNLLVTDKKALLFKKSDFSIYLMNETKDLNKLKLCLDKKENFVKSFSKHFIKKDFIFFAETYQFLDRKTIIAKAEIFPKFYDISFHTDIVKIPKKGKKVLHEIGESDIYKVNIDQTSSRNLNPMLGDLIYFDEKLTPTLRSNFSGRLLKKDGLSYTFQLVHSFCIPKRCIFYKRIKKAQIVKGELLFCSKIYKKQASDIVQGLPKVDNIIEARRGRNYIDSFFISPGIYVGSIESLISSKALSLKDSKSKFFEQLKINLVVNLNKRKKSFKYKKIYDRVNPYSQQNKGLFFQTIKRSAQIFEEIDNSDEYECTLKEKQASLLIIKNIENKEFNKRSFKFIQTGNSVSRKGLNGASLLLSFYFYYQNKNYLPINSSISSIRKLQLIILNSIQSVYYHQGVSISSKHIEIIARQLTSKAATQRKFNIKHKLSRLSFFECYNSTYKEIIKKEESSILFARSDESRNLSLFYGSDIKALQSMFGKTNIAPVYIGSTASSVNKAHGFLSAAGFQDTKRAISKAAIFGSADWLIGLKDSIIAGKKIPAGSSFYYNKNYLDSIYYYKLKRDDNKGE